MVSFDLAGKRALVTGASSAGLGAHFAHVLAEAGAQVTVAARRADRLAELVAELGRDVAALALDVADAQGIAQAIGAAGPFDILVNNAGATITKPLLDQDAADFDAVMNVNLRGAYLLAQEVAKGMIGRGTGGTIVNTASILGLRQGGHVTPYAISKAGLIQLTKQFALELARYKIRVNALAPGYFVTDLNRDVLESESGAAMAKRIALRRFGAYDDLDGPLLLLASDAGRYMTGSILTVDGGHMLLSL
jgi:NAD(P)-dependent dehydrogenase (short-subunit alcohol dehydrogenase family)